MSSLAYIIAVLQAGFRGGQISKCKRRGLDCDPYLMRYSGRSSHLLRVICVSGIPRTPCGCFSIAEFLPL